MIKPISPQEAVTHATLPDWVIQGINNAILLHCKGSKQFTIKQLHIVDEMMKVAPEGTTRDSIFKEGYLDFENIYRKAGWEINYDKPGYNETHYDAFFEFKARRRNV